MYEVYSSMVQHPASMAPILRFHKLGTQIIVQYSIGLVLATTPVPATT